MLHLLYVRYSRLLRRIHNNDDGADDTIETADFAHKTEAFLKEDCREDGSDDDRERS